MLWRVDAAMTRGRDDPRSTAGGHRAAVRRGVDPHRAARRHDGASPRERSGKLEGECFRFRRDGPRADDRHDARGLVERPLREKRGRWGGEGSNSGG